MLLKKINIYIYFGLFTLSLSWKEIKRVLHGHDSHSRLPWLKVIKLAAEKHVRGAITRRGSPDFLRSAAEIQPVELCYLPAVNWFCCHISTRNAELQLGAA